MSLRSALYDTSWDTRLGKRDASTLHSCQRTLLGKFIMEKCCPFKTAMDPSYTLANEDSKRFDDPTQRRSLGLTYRRASDCLAISIGIRRRIVGSDSFSMGAVQSTRSVSARVLSLFHQLKPSIRLVRWLAKRPFSADGCFPSWENPKVKQPSSSKITRGVSALQRQRELAGSKIY